MAVSGVLLNDLFSMIQSGAKVKLGKRKAVGSDNEYKVFELYTEEEIKLNIVNAG